MKLTLNKETLNSRTFWTAITGIVSALALPATIAGRVLGVLGALSVIFIRDAVADQNKPKD